MRSPYVRRVCYHQPAGRGRGCGSAKGRRCMAKKHRAGKDAIVKTLAGRAEGTAAERIWAELHKLSKAEERRPGAFAEGMALAARMGLLRHLLPELYLEEGSCRGQAGPAGRAEEVEDAALIARLQHLSLPPHLPACLRLAACLPAGGAPPRPLRERLFSGCGDLQRWA